MTEEKKEYQRNTSEQMGHDYLQSKQVADLRSDVWEGSDLDGDLTKKRGIFVAIRKVLEDTYTREEETAFDEISKKSIESSFELLQKDIEKYLYGIHYGSNETFKELIKRFEAVCSNGKFSPAAKDAVIEMLNQERVSKEKEREKLIEAQEEAQSKHVAITDVVKQFGASVATLLDETDNQLTAAIDKQKDYSKDTIDAIKEKSGEMRKIVKDVEKGSFEETPNGIQSQRQLREKIKTAKKEEEGSLQKSKENETSLGDLAAAQDIINKFDKALQSPTIKSSPKSKQDRKEKGSSLKDIIKDTENKFQETYDRVKGYLEEGVATYESQGTKAQLYKDALTSLAENGEKFKIALQNAEKEKRKKEQAGLVDLLGDKFKEVFTSVSSPEIVGIVKSEVENLLGGQTVSSSNAKELVTDAKSKIENIETTLQQEQTTIASKIDETRKSIRTLESQVVDNKHFIEGMEDAKDTAKYQTKVVKGEVGRLEGQVELLREDVMATPLTSFIQAVADVKKTQTEHSHSVDARYYEDLAKETLAEEAPDKPHTEEEVLQRCFEIYLVEKMGGVVPQEKQVNRTLTSEGYEPYDDVKAQAIEDTITVLKVSKESYNKVVGFIDGFIKDYAVADPTMSLQAGATLFDKATIVSEVLSEYTKASAGTSVTVDHFAYGSDAANDAQDQLIEQKRIQAVKSTFEELVPGMKFSNVSGRGEPISEVGKHYARNMDTVKTSIRETLKGEDGKGIIADEIERAKDFYNEEKFEQGKLTFIGGQTSRVVKNVVLRNVVEMVGAFRKSDDTPEGAFEKVLDNTYMGQELGASYKKVLGHPALFATKYKNGITSALRYKKEMDQLSEIYERIDDKNTFIESLTEETEINKNTKKDAGEFIAAHLDAAALVYCDIYLREANKTLSNIRADVKVAEVRDLIKPNPARNSKLQADILAALMYGEYDDLTKLGIKDDEIKYLSQKFPALYVADADKYTFMNKDGNPVYVENGEPINREEVRELQTLGNYDGIYFRYQAKLRTWEKIERHTSYRVTGEHMYVKTSEGVAVLPTNTSNNLNMLDLFEAASSIERIEHNEALADARSRAVVHRLYKNALATQAIEDTFKTVVKGFNPTVHKAIMEDISAELKGEAKSLDELDIGSMNLEQIKGFRQAMKDSLVKQGEVFKDGKNVETPYARMSESMDSLLENFEGALVNNSEIIFSEKHGLFGRKTTDTDLAALEDNNPEKLTPEDVLKYINKAPFSVYENEKEYKRQGLSREEIDKIKEDLSKDNGRIRTFINDALSAKSPAAAVTTKEEEAVARAEEEAREQGDTNTGNIIHNNPTQATTDPAANVAAEEQVAEEQVAEEKKVAKGKTVSVGGNAIYGKATDEAKKLAAAVIAFSKAREKYYETKAKIDAEGVPVAETENVTPTVTATNVEQLQPEIPTTATENENVVAGGLTVAEVTELMKDEGVIHGLKTGEALRKPGRTSEQATKTLNNLKTLQELRKDMFWMSLLHSAQHMLAACNNPDEFLKDPNLADDQTEEMRNFVKTYLIEENREDLTANKEQIEKTVENLRLCAGVVSEGENQLSQEDKQNTRKQFMEDRSDEKVRAENIGVDMFAWVGQTRELNDKLSTELDDLLLDNETLATLDSSTKFTALYGKEGMFQGTKDEMMKAMMNNLQNKMQATDALNASAGKPAAPAGATPTAGR